MKVPYRVKDLTGLRFGTLVATAFAGVVWDKNKSSARSQWRCRCDCGRETTMLGQTLRRQPTCGFCHLPANIPAERGKLNLSGLSFGRLVAGFRTSSRRASYVCRCSCGSVVTVLQHSLLSGATNSCGCLKAELATGSGSGRWVGEGGLSGTYWRSVVAGAARRGIRFAITKKFAWSLFVAQNAVCVFTRLPLTISSRSSIGTASLDRKDSCKGYVRGNVQWVHKDVNRMKSTLTTERFLQLCRLITETQLQ